MKFIILLLAIAFPAFGQTNLTSSWLVTNVFGMNTCAQYDGYITFTNHSGTIWMPTNKTTVTIVDTNVTPLYSQQGRLIGTFTNSLQLSGIFGDIHYGCMGHLVASNLVSPSYTINTWNAYIYRGFNDYVQPKVPYTITVTGLTP